MEDAQKKYLEKGIIITYEYMAPDDVSYENQIDRLLKAQDGDYDVIGVDVADEEKISPVLDKMVASGKKVMTFSSSDADPGCKRIAYVGNTHNYQEALHYLQDGINYCLGVQDCYSIGFDTLQVAVKIADGNLPGDLFPDKTDESTTIIYQEDAAPMLEVLYGDVS